MPIHYKGRWAPSLARKCLASAVMSVKNTQAYYCTELNTVLHFKGRLLAISVNIVIGWKWLSQTNMVAYKNRELTMAVKSFMILAPGWLNVRRNRRKNSQVQVMIVLGLYCKILWICNVQKMSIFQVSLFFFIIVSHFHWLGQTHKYMIMILGLIIDIRF